MKLLIFVGSRSWRSANPIEVPVDPNDLKDEDELESYGRYWAERFVNDIVMLVDA